MIKINPGPSLRDFVVTFLTELDFDEDEAMDDLIAHVSQYVNGPWTETQMTFIEPTERERLESMKKYITWRLENSTAGRIKTQLKESKHVTETASA